MTGLAVHAPSISLDGFAAGPGQDEEHPLGVGGERLHEWVFAGDRSAADDRFPARGTEGIGATIMGRDVSGPVRGPWSAAPEWRGRWGEEPPYGHDVFVLTHQARPPLPMAGGTTSHLVTDGPEAALERAAGGAGVGPLAGAHRGLASGGGKGVLAEVHVAVVPVLLGAGERLFDGTAFPAAGGDGRGGAVGVGHPRAAAPDGRLSRRGAPTAPPPT
ncbi:dihydrofolate reductase family protein [Geodermatophilus maliterrae]|uniref:Dihydrofolate reductase family protein n=1 Tax=Geodermatophilus maliterrae TaxID=3162531 RepID=A0ABV3X9E0_9ACTN